MHPARHERGVDFVAEPAHPLLMKSRKDSLQVIQKNAVFRRGAWASEKPPRATSTSAPAAIAKCPALCRRSGAIRKGPARSRDVCQNTGEIGGPNHSIACLRHITTAPGPRACR